MILIFIFIFVNYNLQGPTENRLGEWVPWINIFIIIIIIIIIIKSTHGFPFVSHMSMGLRLAALRAAGAPL